MYAAGSEAVGMAQEFVQNATAHKIEINRSNPTMIGHARRRPA